MPSKKLGSHLEWHGNRIRVVVRVPPFMVARVGRTKLKQTLTTTDPLEAEREKVDVIRRLRATLTGERITVVQSSIVAQALEVKRLRDAGELVMVGGDEDADHEDDAFQAHVDDVENRHGYGAAQTFAAIALGTQTPLPALLDRMFAEKVGLSIGYRDDIKRALGRLEAWCDGTRTPKCQTAWNVDPGSASKIDPLDGYGVTPLISPAERVGVAQPG